MKFISLLAVAALAQTDEPETEAPETGDAETMAPTEAPAEATTVAGTDAPTTAAPMATTGAPSQCACEGIDTFKTAMGMRRLQGEGEGEDDNGSKIWYYGSWTPDALCPAAMCAASEAGAGCLTAPQMQAVGPMAMSCALVAGMEAACPAECNDKDAWAQTAVEGQPLMADCAKVKCLAGDKPCREAAGTVMLASLPEGSFPPGFSPDQVGAALITTGYTEACDADGSAFTAWGGAVVGACAATCPTIGALAQHVATMERRLQGGGGMPTKPPPPLGDICAGLKCAKDSTGDACATGRDTEDGKVYFPLINAAVGPLCGAMDQWVTACNIDPVPNTPEEHCATATQIAADKATLGEQCVGATMMFYGAALSTGGPGGRRLQGGGGESMTIEQGAALVCSLAPTSAPTTMAATTAAPGGGGGGGSSASAVTVAGAIALALLQ